MINPSEPPMVAFGSAGPRRWLRVEPAPCQHIRTSRDLIHHASASVQPGQVIILGAGRCQEIPLRELAQRFERVILNDHDVALLEEALTSSGLSNEQTSNVQLLVADLTEVTDRFLAQVSEHLDVMGDPSVTTAAERIALLAETTHPQVFTAGEKFDLVIASCVLCQLHLEICNQTIARFALRFPGQETFFRQSPSWTHAMYGLARRMEQAFIHALHGLVSPGGRIYLSETVQSAFLHPTPEGHWVTDGVYRMTHTTQLSDYLDERFQIERQAQWHWIIEPSQPTGRVGRLYNTQGLVLSVEPVPSCGSPNS
jgi:hypothetical protein